MDIMDKEALNMEDLKNVTGGTPMSIPGGKRSGRKNSENALEIADWLGDKFDNFLEGLGLKQKPVDNRIYDRTVPIDDYIKG